MRFTHTHCTEITHQWIKKKRSHRLDIVCASFIFFTLNTFSLNIHVWSIIFAGLCLEEMVVLFNKQSVSLNFKVSLSFRRYWNMAMTASPNGSIYHCATLQFPCCFYLRFHTYYTMECCCCSPSGTHFFSRGWKGFSDFTSWKLL